jgi:hypothetical protein
MADFITYCYGQFVKVCQLQQTDVVNDDNQINQRHPFVTFKNQNSIQPSEHFTLYSQDNERFFKINLKTYIIIYF